MRFLLCVLTFVTLYHQNKCQYDLTIDIAGIGNSFSSLRDFLNSVFVKTSDIFGFSNTEKESKKMVDSQAFKQMADKNTARKSGHSAWEDGAARYPIVPKPVYKDKKMYQLSAPLLAEWHGFKMETHMIKTEDGYYLTTHRISEIAKLRKRTILLHHGLLGSSMDWILLGLVDSVLPYMLVEAGYDVWLMNARGNNYSRNHATLTVTSSDFWDFSFDEMGLIDLPAVIDYIRNNNDVPIDFVGYSMGSTAFLVFLSSLPEYKKYLRVGVLIAPLAFMRYVRSPLKNVADKIIKAMGTGEFFPHRIMPRALAKYYCRGPARMCYNPLFFLSGVPAKTSATARVEEFVPAGGSTKTILHYIQLAKSGIFHRFNNKSHEYDIKSIDVPIALISSNDDYLAEVKDVEKIYKSIINPIDHHVIKNKKVSHTDFLWDKTAAYMVFRKTLGYLEKGLEWSKDEGEAIIIDTNSNSSREDEHKGKSKSKTKKANGINKFEDTGKTKDKNISKVKKNDNNDNENNDLDNNEDDDNKNEENGEDECENKKQPLDKDKSKDDEEDDDDDDDDEEEKVDSIDDSKDNVKGSSTKSSKDNEDDEDKAETTKSSKDDEVDEEKAVGCFKKTKTINKKKKDNKKDKDKD